MKLFTSLPGSAVESLVQTMKQLEWKAGRVRRWAPIGTKVGVALVAVYTLLSVALFIAMKQTPMRFATVMSKLPMISMMVLPFETLWNIARAGDLKVGDPAPDFRLRAYQKSASVQLSGFRGDRPVVLIFGSYT
ncbi:MAG: hypothetical protein AB1898_32495 [Acidobacteriota bacterium]